MGSMDWRLMVVAVKRHAPPRTATVIMAIIIFLGEMPGSGGGVGLGKIIYGHCLGLA